MNLNWLMKTLAARFGWNSEVLSLDALERAVRRRVELRGLTRLDGYLQSLRVDESELLELAQEFLVPETWFFREPDTLDKLVGEVRQRWQDSLQPVRLLSCPCSTGEEPYSIALTLLAAGLPQEAFRVEGVDLSAQALETALAGVYGSYSFRAGLRNQEQYFEPHGEGWKVQSWVGRSVNFRRANLLDKTAFDPHSYDVVCCRNLLIYFGKEGREQTFSAIHRMLKDGGLLCTGICEVALAPLGLFDYIPKAGGALFRKAGKRETAPEPVMLPNRPVALPQVPSVPPKVPAPRDSRESIIAALRRTIYLNPTDHGAMLQLALFEEHLGQAETARRLRQRAWRVQARSIQ